MLRLERFVRMKTEQTSESIRRKKIRKSERFRIRVRVIMRRTGAKTIDKSKNNDGEKKSE